MRTQGPLYFFITILFTNSQFLSEFLKCRIRAWISLHINLNMNYYPLINISLKQFMNILKLLFINSVRDSRWSAVILQKLQKVALENHSGLCDSDIPTVMPDIGLILWMMQVKETILKKFENQLVFIMQLKIFVMVNLIFCFVRKFITFNFSFSGQADTTK